MARSLYPVGASLLAAFKDELAAYEVDRGTIRFPLNAPVPVKLIPISRFSSVANMANKRRWRRGAVGGVDSGVKRFGRSVLDKSRGCYELCELACASTIAFCSLCLLLLPQLLSSAPEPRSLFFLSSPWQPKLRRISVRKSN